MPTHFRFAESAPDHRLAPWLGRYWEFSVHDGAPPIHYVPPDGCTSLLVATGVGRTPVLVVTGPWLEPLPVPVRPGDQFWGVRLRPGAAGEFLGVDVATLRNNAMPVGQRLGALGGVLAVAVSAAESLAEAAATMDAAFLPLIAGLALPDPLVADVVAHLLVSRGDASIGAIAAEIGVSPRTLHRRFTRATGIAPKPYARIVRLRLAAMTLIGSDPGLAAVAAMGGYADQPHLNREVADLLGISPRRLADLVRATTHENISH